MVGTDGRHLIAANSFLFDIPASLIVPNRKFISWQGFHDDGQWTLRFQPEKKKKTALFRVDRDHWTYIAKPIEGVYPNWQQVVPEKSGPTKVILGEPGVKTILEALPLLPCNDALTRPVSLEVNNNDFQVKARASDKDRWSCIPVPAAVSGPSVVIAVNRDLVAKAIRFGFTELAIEDSLSPMIFTGKGKMMIVMPLRPDPPAGSPAAKPTDQPPAPQPVQSTSPQENVSAAAPSTAEPIVTTVNESDNTVSQNTMTAPPRGNLNGETATATEPPALDEMAIALNKQPDGSFGLTADFWDGHVEEEVGKSYGKLLQLYAVHKAIREARKKGHTTRRLSQQDGSIKLVLMGA